MSNTFQAFVVENAESLATVIIESSNDAIISMTLDGMIISWNAAAERIYGYAAEEALGKSIVLIIPAELAHEEKVILEKIGKGEKVEHYQSNRVRKDGTRIEVSLTVSPIRSKSGDIIGASKISRNITERKQAEDRYRSLFESTIDAVFIGDSGGNYVDVNPAAAEMLGVPREQLIGQHYSNFIPPEMIEEAKKLRLQVRQQGHYRGEFPMRRTDGSTVWAEYRTRFNGQYVIGVARDVTERKRMEEALRQSEERLRLALDGARIGMWSVDVATNELECTPLNVEIFGLPLNGPAPKIQVWIDLVHPDDRAKVLAAWEGGLAQAAPYAIEYRIIRPDGSIRWIDTRGRFHTDESGGPVRVIGISMDITERKQAEERLREADRRKDEFLAMLAHELRNPLAPIRTAVKMLNQVGPQDRQLQKMRDVIDRQTEHLARLVDDLLDIARITQGKIQLKKERAELPAIVGRAVETSRPIIEARRHQLLISLVEAPLEVEGDMVRLTQVVSNLLNNAAKYTEEGGQIRLKVERSGTEILLSIKDTGMGIPAKDLPYIFDLFAQADRSLDRAQGGLGVGLTLVKRIVELHGGSVAANSEGVGHGTEFIIRLPSADGAATQARSVTEAKAETIGGCCRVLVVDDSIDGAEMMKLLLRLDGHEVEMTHDGLSAIEITRWFRPHVVLLDIGLPGMNGYETARAMKEEIDFKTVLIALTGYGQPEDRSRSKEAGFEHHFTKPVDYDTLLKLIKSYIFE